MTSAIVDWLAYLGSVLWGMSGILADVLAVVLAVCIVRILERRRRDSGV